jgi:hypothetical protein
MPLTYADEQWLENAGYEHHCFISWPHTGDKDLSKCAERVEADIMSGLSEFITVPKVWRDEPGLQPGDIWSDVIKQKLCRTVAMVAICGPMYYHPRHFWCGLEWAAMQAMSDARLHGYTFAAVLPIIAKKRGPLPIVVSAIQFADLSGLIAMSAAPYKTNEYRLKIARVVNRIEEIAKAIVANQSYPDCNNFQFPTVSAFDNYLPEEQASPIER